MRTVLLDIDGVIINYIDDLLSALRFRGHNVRMPSYWDLRDIGVPQSEIDSVTGRRDFCTLLPLYPGAREFLAKLRKDYRVIACTSPADRSPYWASERYHVLREIGFAKRDIILCSDKAQIRGDVLIDDNPENVSAFDQDGRLGVLLDRPYNQGPCQGLRAMDLEHCYRVLRTLLSFRVRDFA
jgi:5'(3')-deoxyribonucleotidase